jgi:hypothetical protein
MGWTVFIEVAGGGTIDGEKLERLVDHLARHGAAISGTPERPPDGLSRYGAQFDVDARDALDALRHGEEVFRVAARNAGLPAWPVVIAEVMTVAEQERQLARAL